MSVKAQPQHEPSFSKLRSAIWPIQGSEMKKFLPMGLMMFFILFNYTILRDTKDTLVVNASGAEAINFLKFWGVMPSSILFVIIYAKISNVLNREALFYACIVPFLVFFGAFALLIYPNKELLHPTNETVEAMKAAYPGLRFIFALWGSWSYSIFYIMSELWGSVVVSLLFWQFANEITRTAEAKRFYALFALLGNVALILSGQTVAYLSDIRDLYPPEVDAWGISLNYMMGAVVIAGIACVAIYWWMNRFVLTDPFYYDAAETSKKTKKDKPKLSIAESFKYLLTSKYIGYIALLVLGYGMAINLVEVTWKSQLKLQYQGNENAYSAFMGNFSTFTGIGTITLILLCKGIVRKFGWYYGAILTPIVLLITGVMFFTFVIFREDLNWMTVAMGTTPLFMAVMLGAIQNILSKGTKYSLFDPTKEMAYIPLDQELKVKGKAAVDVIGGRLGKSGGGIIQQVLLLTSATATQITIAPYVCVCMVVVIIAWMYAVGGLSRMYNEAVGEQEKPSKKKA